MTKDEAVKVVKDNLVAIQRMAEDAEANNGGSFTAEQRAEASKRLDAIKDARTVIESSKQDDDIRAAVADLAGIGVSDPEDAPDPTPSRVKSGSVGSRFVEDPAIKGWLGNVDPYLRGDSKSRVGVSPPVVFGGMKDVLHSGEITDGIITSDDKGLLDPLLFRPFVIRDIITVGATDSDTVTFVKENTKTNAAAPVAEATADDGVGAAGGVKPESAFDLVKVTENVKIVAHVIPATKQALADASQTRTLIDGFLRSGLIEEVEDQIIAGDGTGENFTGLENASGTLSQAFSTDILETARKAKTQVMVTGRAVPTAYLLHPNDWEAFDLTKDANDRYYFGGPMDMGTPRLWGLPVVVSEAVTEGTGWVGDFRKMVVWDRQQATVSVTDSHSDFFIRNLVMFLAELRLAFGIIRPAAFCSVDMSAAT